MLPHPSSNPDGAKVLYVSAAAYVGSKFSHVWEHAASLMGCQLHCIWGACAGGGGVNRVHAASSLRATTAMAGFRRGAAATLHVALCWHPAVQASIAPSPPTHARLPSTTPANAPGPPPHVPPLPAMGPRDKRVGAHLHAHQQHLRRLGQAA